MFKVRKLHKCSNLTQFLPIRNSLRILADSYVLAPKSAENSWTMTRTKQCTTTHFTLLLASLSKFGVCAIEKLNAPMDGRISSTGMKSTFFAFFGVGYGAGDGGGVGFSPETHVPGLKSPVIGPFT
eukprot:m.1191302 g.1191302  ORF g.1191302 m.1191302 type:complete len:126 (+) comp24556_c1_seq59:4526-4903(+)